MIRKKLTQTGALGLPNGVVVGVVVGHSLGNTDLVATLLESLGIIIKISDLTINKYQEESTSNLKPHHETH